MTYIEIPRWDDFQHTDATKRGRDPIWIKTYTRLLSDDAYLELTGHRRAILHGLWLEYARSGRRLPDDTRTLTRRLDMRITTPDLHALEAAGFLTITRSHHGLTVVSPAYHAHDAPSPQPEPHNHAENEANRQDSVTPPSILEERRVDLKPKSERPIAVVRPPVDEGPLSRVDELAAWRLRERKRRTG